MKSLEVFILLLCVFHISLALSIVPSWGKATVDHTQITNIFHWKETFIIQTKGNFSESKSTQGFILNNNKIFGMCLASALHCGV